MNGQKVGFTSTEMRFYFYLIFVMMSKVPLAFFRTGLIEILVRSEMVLMYVTPATFLDPT